MSGPDDDGYWPVSILPSFSASRDIGCCQIGSRTSSASGFPLESITFPMYMLTSRAMAGRSSRTEGLSMFQLIYTAKKKNRQDSLHISSESICDVHED